MLPSGLPEDVGDEEKIARFITSKSQYGNGMVKGSAFVPPSTGELSVCRHNGNPVDELTVLSKEYIVSRTVYGAAIVSARFIRGEGLELAAKEPPGRHADVVQWPDNKDPEEQAIMRKDIAALVAENATLIRF